MSAFPKDAVSRAPASACTFTHLYSAQHGNHVVSALINDKQACKYGCNKTNLSTLVHVSAYTSVRYTRSLHSILRALAFIFIV